MKVKVELKKIFKFLEEKFFNKGTFLKLIFKKDIKLVVEFIFKKVLFEKEIRKSLVKNKVVIFIKSKIFILEVFVKFLVIVEFDKKDVKVLSELEVVVIGNLLDFDLFFNVL